MRHLTRIYFLGIGGIGMSALARYFNDQGIKIFGYDKTETTLTKKLVEEGMKIHFDDNVRKIPEGIDLVIYTPAIPDDHEELNYFKRNYYELKKRAEVLGLISRTKQTIAVAGTHGKTTTSSFISHVLNECGFKASSLVGGIMTNYSSNYIKGDNDWIIVEADEYDRSFLQLSPDIAVIMSMDPDHLDIYGKHDEMVRSFEKFTRKIKDNGKLVIVEGLKEKFSEDWEVNMRKSGIEILEISDSKGQFSYGQLHYSRTEITFELQGIDWRMKDLTIKMPGKHNVENASAAIVVAMNLGQDPDKIKNALRSFKGIKRRFEYVLDLPDLVFIDDYAHHPRELRAAIDTVKKLFPQKKITGIFQPHLYSRTLDFAAGFAEALDELDEVILIDIYPARELPIAGVDSGIIFDKMQNPNKTWIGKKEIVKELKNKKIEVLITLGAGDIDAEVERIKEAIQDNE